MLQLKDHLFPSCLPKLGPHLGRECKETPVILERVWGGGEKQQNPFLSFFLFFFSKSLPASRDTKVSVKVS